MTLDIIAQLLVLGSFTGFLAGLLGIGGGMIITPFLTMLMSGHIPPAFIVHASIATSLATIMFTSISSLRSHNKHGAVRWDIVRMMAPGILTGALIGANISSLLPTFWISLVFVIFVGFSAVKMFMNAKPPATGTLPGNAGLFGVGNVVGIVSSIVGAGGGFISVPFMVRSNVEMHHAVGTSAALGLPIAIAGTVGYIVAGMNVEALLATPGMVGYIHVPALLCVATASVLLAPVGARVAHRTDTKPLKRFFACMLFAIAGFMLNKALASL